MKLSTPHISDAQAVGLLERAAATMARTYPIANTGYSAAVLAEDGAIYEGASYLSQTQTLTMHGEMVALAHAAIHGAKRIVAITGPNCHICKQLIWESALHSGIDVQVILEKAGTVLRVPISTLMPYAWPISGEG
jgi:cytidine deaminase